jgi:hypothetical protein
VNDSRTPNYAISYIIHQLQSWMFFMLSSLTLDKYLQPLFPILFSAEWMIDVHSESVLSALHLTFEKWLIPIGDIKLFPTLI